MTVYIVANQLLLWCSESFRSQRFMLHSRRTLEPRKCCLQLSVLPRIATHECRRPRPCTRSGAFRSSVTLVSSFRSRGTHEHAQQCHFQFLFVKRHLNRGPWQRLQRLGARVHVSTGPGSHLSQTCEGCASAVPPLLPLAPASVPPLTSRRAAHRLRPSPVRVRNPGVRHSVSRRS